MKVTTKHEQFNNKQVLVREIFFSGCVALALSSKLFVGY